MTAEIAGVIASLQASFEISKAFLGLRDTALIQSKVIELQGQILAAHQSALAAQDAQAALSQRVRDIEQEVTDLKAWGAEKQKYELAPVGPGSFAYTLKPDAGSTEPSHSLCPNCYQDGHKSILQAQARSLKKVLHCPRCKEDIIVGRADAPVPF
jgi:hypothetical protein